jgi:hypothetical protein
LILFNYTTVAGAPGFQISFRNYGTPRESREKRLAQTSMQQGSAVPGKIALQFSERTGADVGTLVTASNDENLWK